MVDPAMIKEFPDTGQRYAVCQRRAKAAAAVDLVSEPGALTI